MQWCCCGGGGLCCKNGCGCGNVSVAGGGGARWSDCCRFPNGVFGELWKDLPYHLLCLYIGWPVRKR